jgi:hypothetical protein
MIRALGSGALTYAEISTDLGADGPALRQVVHRYPTLFIRIPGLDGIARIGLAAPSEMA